MRFILISFSFDQLLVQAGQRPCLYRILCLCAARRFLSKTHNCVLWQKVLGNSKVLDCYSKSSLPSRPFLTSRQSSGRALEYFPPASCSWGRRHKISEHLSVYQTFPELWEREAFEEQLD